jgi:hypothetical protein
MIAEDELRAQDLLKKNGNPPAQFEFEESSFLVKIFRRQD